MIRPTAQERAERDRVVTARGQDTAMRVLSYLLAGMICYGGLGWLLDRWLHTGFCLPIGLVLGAGLGIYTIIRRFGVETPQPAADEPAAEAVRTGKERR